MSLLAILLIVMGALVLVILIGGLVASRRREAEHGGAWRAEVRGADRALQDARAADKGWDRPALEEAARRALAEQRPGFGVAELHLVLVDDRPGEAEDRAHFVAVGAEGEARIVLCRGSGGWSCERLD
jgi:hypothetical protein